jgi:arsenate reductase
MNQGQKKTSCGRGGLRLEKKDKKRIKYVMTPVLYGIKNCDTMKKARAWLDARGRAYVFHDYKAAGIDRKRLQGWASRVGWEMLLNRAGTTFRKLPEADRDGLTEAKAIDLMLAQPSMIKRPVLELGGGKVMVGFKPELYDDIFNK